MAGFTALVRHLNKSSHNFRSHLIFPCVIFVYGWKFFALFLLNDVFMPSVFVRKSLKRVSNQVLECPGHLLRSQLEASLHFPSLENPAYIISILTSYSNSPCLLFTISGSLFLCRVSTSTQRCPPVPISAVFPFTKEEKRNVRTIYAIRLTIMGVDGLIRCYRNRFQ